MELWDLYDKHRKLLNKTSIRGEELLHGENHMIVEVWTINEKHKLLLTKRHPHKNFMSVLFGYIHISYEQINRRIIMGRDRSG